MQRLKAFKKVRRKRVIRLHQGSDSVRLDKEDMVARLHLSVIGGDLALEA